MRTAQSDLSLRWAHRSFCWFCRAVAQIAIQLLCFFIDCGTITEPSNGAVSYSNNGATTYQEVATFTCDAGYDLSGDATRTCEASGNWGGATPVCNIKGKPYFVIFMSINSCHVSLELTDKAYFYSSIDIFCRPRMIRYLC